MGREVQRKERTRRKSNSKAGFIAIWTRERDREQSNMESMNTALQQQRLEVEQLRREAAMKRIPVSQAVEDIKRYAMDHMMQDHLIVGFASEKAILSVRRLGLVTFSRNFPRIFQEIHISLSISPVLNQLSLLYTSQCTRYRLFAYYGLYSTSQPRRLPLDRISREKLKSFPRKVIVPSFMNWPIFQLTPGIVPQFNYVA